jgi:hypothetical protein
MLAVGSLSEAAYGLRQLLVGGIADLEADISRIRIGHPGTNLKPFEDKGENGLNLFFYHVTYDGYPADGAADNPLYIRLYCLITAIGQELKKDDPGNSSGRDISKGENELRLVGEVMKVLHENPLCALRDSDEEVIASLQIVPHSVSLDDLNHIWATQGSETPYRLSLAYEMSLAPVPLAVPLRSAPLAGDPQLLSWGALSRKPGTEKAGLSSFRPQVEDLEIDTSAPDWVPHLALVDNPGTPAAGLHYVFKVEAAVSVALDVLIAGAGGEHLKLYWNVWRRNADNSVLAWRENIQDSQTPEAVLRAPSPLPDRFYPERINPGAIDARSLFKVRLPALVGEPGTKTWQATLTAVRDWQHADPADSGRILMTPIRSNLLLLYGEGP